MSNLNYELRTAIKKQRFGPKKRLYLVNGTVIGKQFLNNDMAEAEYKFGDELLHKGINVPEMYELIEPNIVQKLFVPKWYVLMQRIEASPISELNADEKKEALKQYRSDLEKILSFGIAPGDHHDHDVFFDRKKGALYWLDFERWTKATPEDVKWFKDSLKEEFYPCWISSISKN